jgi:hypothetical protein
MRASDTPKREERLLSMFGHPVELEDLEIAPTDERVRANLRWLDHIVGFKVEDAAALMN